MRAQGASRLTIGGGVEYSRDLSWVLQNPVPDDNVAYASHIYPSHSVAMWQHWFGNVGQQHPVLNTEWGFMDENPSPTRPYLNGNRDQYG